MKTVDEIMELVQAFGRHESSGNGWESHEKYAEIEAALKEREGESIDSMVMPVSCGKPLCSPNDHHPLCRLAPPKAQPMSSEQRLAVLASIPKWLWVTAYTPQPAALIIATERHHKIGD